MAKFRGRKIAGVSNANPRLIMKMNLGHKSSSLLRRFEVQSSELIKTGTKEAFMTIEGTFF